MRGGTRLQCSAPASLQSVVKLEKSGRKARVSPPVNWNLRQLGSLGEECDGRGGGGEGGGVGGSEGGIGLYQLMSGGVLCCLCWCSC